MKYEIWPTGAQRAGQGQRAPHRYGRAARGCLLCHRHQ